MFIKNVNNTTKVINIVEIQELYKFERRIKMSEDVNNNPNNIEEGEELDNIIVLNDEQGNEVQFEFLDLVELDNEEYVVLLPVTDEGEEDEGEVVILKLEDTDEDSEGESYVGVEDEEILNQVFSIFKEKYKDEFNFVDED